MNDYNIIPKEVVLNNIYHLRGHTVMLDRDLAKLYGVETKYLKPGLCIRLRNESLKWLLDRHSHRFLQRKHNTVMVSRKNRACLPAGRQVSRL